MTSHCTIVIRCYNEEAYIGKLLHGIGQQTEKNTEIVIVDSGSTDKTLEIASEFPVNIVNIPPKEFSFGRSLNLGCEAAQGEFIVVASAHVFPLYRDWLTELLTPFEKENIGLVYGKQVGGSATRFSEHQVLAKWFPDESNPLQPHPFCNNANAAIRHSLWRRYPYNEELTGLEDIDWAHRLMQAGYWIAYQARAVVAHIHNEKPLQIFNRYRREAMALKTIFADEKFQLWDFLKLYATNVASDYSNAILSKAFFSNWFDILRFRLMQFWGTYRGFKESGHISERLKKTLYYPSSPNHRNNCLIGTEHREKLLVDYSSKDCSYE